MPPVHVANGAGESRPGAALSEHMAGAAGEAMFRHACALGLEGIVSKRVTSRYKSGSCLAARKHASPRITEAFRVVMARWQEPCHSA